MSLRDQVRSIIPEWGPVRWTAVVIAVAVLACSGISLFHVPKHEIMYSESRIVIPIRETGDTLVSYFVEVGNTGRTVLETAEIKFTKAAMDRIVLPVSVRNFGITDRPFTVTAEGDVTAIKIEGIEPEKRIKLAFILKYSGPVEPETWEQIFVGIDIPRGSVKHGDPGMTMVGRAWFRLFGDLLPF